MREGGREGEREGTRRGGERTRREGGRDRGRDGGWDRGKEWEGDMENWRGRDSQKSKSTTSAPRQLPTNLARQNLV